MNTRPAKSGDSLKAAFAALLEGDTAERDRLCRLAEMQMQAEARSAALAQVLGTDFYVSADGTAYTGRAVFNMVN